MNYFHETRMGHEFYLGTMPKLVRTLEETNNQLAGIIEKIDKVSVQERSTAEKETEGIYPWANYAVDNNTIEAALKKAEDDSDRSFFSLVIDTVESDYDGKAACLFTSYRDATAAERRVMDGVFVELTGWSLATLIRKYAEKERGNK